LSEGYSATPLLAKLGYRDGQQVLLVDLPEGLAPALLRPTFACCHRLASGDPLPPGLPPLDLAHLFVTGRVVLERWVDMLRPALAPAGMLWVSWPKKAARVPTDITEDTVRAVALPAGLVDVKVCAVDAVWSGLKLVLRKALRPPTRRCLLSAARG
jgi:hypothetical protein